MNIDEILTGTIGFVIAMVIVGAAIGGVIYGYYIYAQHQVLANYLWPIAEAVPAQGGGYWLAVINTGHEPFFVKYLIYPNGQSQAVNSGTLYHNQHWLVKLSQLPAEVMVCSAVNPSVCVTAPVHGWYVPQYGPRATATVYVVSPNGIAWTVEIDDVVINATGVYRIPVDSWSGQGNGGPYYADLIPGVPYQFNVHCVALVNVFGPNAYTDCYVASATPYGVGRTFTATNPFNETIVLIYAFGGYKPQPPPSPPPNSTKGPPGNKTRNPPPSGNNTKYYCYVTAYAYDNIGGASDPTVSPPSAKLAPGQNQTFTFSVGSTTVTINGTTYDFEYWVINGQYYYENPATYTFICPSNLNSNEKVYISGTATFQPTSSGSGGGGGFCPPGGG